MTQPINSLTRSNAFTLGSNRATSAPKTNEQALNKHLAKFTAQTNTQSNSAPAELSKNLKKV